MFTFDTCFAAAYFALFGILQYKQAAALYKQSGFKGIGGVSYVLSFLSTHLYMQIAKNVKFRRSLVVTVVVVQTLCWSFDLKHTAMVGLVFFAQTLINMAVGRALYLKHTTILA